MKGRPTATPFRPVPLGAAHRLINHGPLVLVGSGTERRPSLAPVAWVMPADDDPPIVALALSTEHWTTALIRRHRTFTVNVPGAEQAGAVKLCGRVSGRRVDKFRAAGLTPERGIKVSTPHVREALAFLECRLRDARRLPGVTVMFADVLWAAARPLAFRNGVYAPAARTFHHLGAGRFAVTGRRFR